MESVVIMSMWALKSICRDNTIEFKSTTHFDISTVVMLPHFCSTKNVV